MGCDIHLMVEARTARTTPWERVEVKYPCRTCEGTGRLEDRGQLKAGPCYMCGGTGKTVGYSNRNYDTFAILAGVRNGRGFAGTETGGGFNPIAEPRGIPEDCSLRFDEYGRQEGDEDARDLLRLGDHSHSWVTLAELLAYDWQQRTHEFGVMSLAQYRDWKKQGGGWPKGGYCGGISGRLVYNVSNACADALIADDIDKQTAEKVEFAKQCRWPQGTTEHDYPSFHTRVRWETTYAEAASSFHEDFLPALRGYAEERGLAPENVRLVFGFDS